MGLLDQGATVNDVSLEGATPLYVAALNGRLKVVKPNIISFTVLKCFHKLSGMIVVHSCLA
jgi:hypothetical protein